MTKLVTWGLRARRLCIKLLESAFGGKKPYPDLLDTVLHATKIYYQLNNSKAVPPYVRIHTIHVFSVLRSGVPKSVFVEASLKPRAGARPVVATLPPAGAKPRPRSQRGAAIPITTALTVVAVAVVAAAVAVAVPSERHDDPDTDDDTDERSSHA